MSFNLVITNIKAEKKTINQIPNTNTLIMDSNYVEFSGNLIVNGDSIINGNTTISNELFIEGNSNVIINNYDVSENSVQQTVYNPYIPFGAVVSFATKKAPDGWLACDGSYVLKADYQNLFDVIGNIWDKCNDNDNTRFRLPDLNISSSFIRGGNVDGIINEHTTKKPINDFDMSLNGTTSSDGGHHHNVYNTTNALGHPWSPFPDRIKTHDNSTTREVNGIDGGGNHNHSFQTTIVNSSSIEDWDNETFPIHVKLLYCIKY